MQRFWDILGKSKLIECWFRPNTKGPLTRGLSVPRDGSINPPLNVPIREWVFYMVSTFGHKPKNHAT
jgi:hypothetical protein